MKYQRQIRQALSRIKKFGVAEVWWHPEAKGPVVRTGLFETKQLRNFEDHQLIGRYTDVCAYDIFLDIEEYVKKVLGHPQRRGTKL